ncbi:MAG: phosphate transport system regulatory protein PhoU, partial [Lachnospiraceae bacterium]|nr:phosphate transport system regulatory protein PhoU [Lachnospiraceae bacterium]
IVMVIQSLQAYVNKDMEQAKAVITRDDVVDDLFLTVKKEILVILRENAEYGEQAEDLLMAAKYFERIGDHAVNIAEWVIFSITGRHVDDK